jgi:hypothetical protein
MVHLKNYIQFRPKINKNGISNPFLLLFTSAQMLKFEKRA